LFKHRINKSIEKPFNQRKDRKTFQLEERSFREIIIIYFLRLPKKKRAEEKFCEFSTSLIGTGISIYTDGSRRDVDSAVGAAVFPSELSLAIKHKLSTDSSIFSAEAWTLYQVLILIESSGYRRRCYF